MSTTDRPVVVLDFDGFLHSYVSGWTGPEPLDPPVEGSQHLVNWLIQNGYEPVVVSTRAISGRGRIEIEHWLRKHGFPRLRVTDEKVQAILYADDRGFRFDGTFRPLIDFLIQNPQGDTWVDALG